MYGCICTYIYYIYILYIYIIYIYISCCLTLHSTSPSSPHGDERILRWWISTGRTTTTTAGLPKGSSQSNRWMSMVMKGDKCQWWTVMKGDEWWCMVITANEWNCPSIITHGWPENPWSICLSVCLSICLSIYLPIHPSIHLSMGKLLNEMRIFPAFHVWFPGVRIKIL